MKNIQTLNLVAWLMISLLFSSCFYGIKGNGKVLKTDVRLECLSQYQLAQA